MGRLRAMGWLGTVLTGAALIGCDPVLIVGRERGAAVGGGAGAVSTGGSGGVPSGTGGSAAFGTGASAGAGDEGDGLLWMADHETGTLEEWLSGGVSEGGQYGSVDVLEISDERSRSANRALKIRIDTSMEGARVARVYRAVVEESAYYSAWFFLEEDHAVNEWWSIFLFRGHEDPSDIDTAYYLWDLNLTRDAEDNLTLALYDQQAGRTTPARAGTRMAVGEWQHIEAFLDRASSEAPSLRYWLNGELVLEVSDLSAPLSPWLYWAVGNGANSLDPAVSTIYIDDAAISLRPLGH